MLECTRRLKKAEEGSRRLKQAQEGSRRLKKTQEGSRRFKNVLEGSQRFQKIPEVLKGSKGFQKFQEGSRVPSPNEGLVCLACVLCDRWKIWTWPIVSRLVSCSQVIHILKN